MSPAHQAQPPLSSLLWLGCESASGAPPASSVASDDLRLKVIADAISPHVDYSGPIHNLLATLLADEETLRYRQDVLEDCLANPTFSEGLRALLPQLRNLRNTVRDIRARRNQVSLVLSRLTELEDYIECVAELEALLRKHLQALLPEAARRRTRNP